MKNKILRIFLLIILFLGIYTITSSASYISNDPTVSSGDTFTITIKSTEELANYDIKLSSYSGLTFSGCSANQGAAVNSNTGAISFATLGAGTTTLGTYTFKAPEVSETKNYSVVFKVNGTTNTSNVTVKAKETNNSSNQNSNNDNNKNNDNSSNTSAELSSITVNGKKYTNPKKDITITVGSEVDSATVSAVSTDGSKVSGVGDIALKAGTNIIKLGVSGTTYTLRINRMAEVEDTPNIIDETEETQKQPEEALALNTLEVKDFELTPEFSKDIYTYTINIDMEKNDLQQLEINAIANREDAKIEITGNENLKEGENIINITISSEDGTETVTYQLKVNKIISSTEVVGKTDMDTANEELENATKMSRTTRIIIMVIAVVGIMLGIIFAVIEYIYTNKKDDEHEYNEPFYIKEDEDGRLNVVDKNEDTDVDVSDYKNEEEKTEDSKPTGYIEELYKNNFSEEDLDLEEPKIKKKKVKGKHF